jgi:hypothetical protein
MNEVYLVKHKFKPRMKQSWLDWCEELKKRKDEALATMKNESAPGSLLSFRVGKLRILFHRGREP